jgi:hypothetical protein
MPSAWGHTRLLETDWRFITQESHCFSCGSVNPCFYGYFSREASLIGRLFWGFSFLPEHGSIHEISDEISREGKEEEQFCVFLQLYAVFTANILCFNLGIL